ncbi:hypothetical protein GCK72_000563 [Caenorhabditis remanei]|uniref:mRNA-capping enzyme n=1 Tax=Caenorhabditis remanei TaxID=31234 RepID=A0A6A5HKP5_CAERE|nr:hypothetical protein GCK72_000563 [Caenorhabditis remanei]KAF1768750.1 hypothetical protein GCK72_000563 [Caenorhabditis remanei]
MAPKGPTPDKARLGLPDRWLHCPKTGTLVNDLFFPFKTPLCKMYDQQIAERKLQFHPSDVFTSPFLNGRKLGLWIDLTNTDRYYFPDEVTEKGCIYRKIAMAGRGMSPTKEETDKFIEIVQEFHEKNPDLVVGIHCTHGFNRTGFLIAAFLFQVNEYGLDAAITEVAGNRQGGIYKQDYIDDLYERYDPGEDDRIVAPEKPDWERDTANLIDNAVPSSSQPAAHSNGNGHQNGHSQNGRTSNSKQFMDGLIEGVRHCEDPGKKSILQAKVQELCKWNKQGFPGLQPVSLSRKNIKLLEEEDYMVSWKADGMRYIVYMNDGEVYAFDRDNEVFEIENLDFVTKDGSPLLGTLVDTEVIIDKVMEHGYEVNKPRMLIYDIMRFAGFNVMKEPFHKRFEIIQTEIINKRKAAFVSGRIRPERQIMSVRRKDFYDLCATAKLFEPKFVQHVGHEIDGLIFQPKHRPYETGRCDKVLKWKPPSHNSVDFLLKIERHVREGMLPEWTGNLFVQNCQQPFGTMPVTGSLRAYNNKIIECTMTVDDHGRPKSWKFMRERTDKSLPNGLNTAKNVVDTMVNPVTEQYLTDYIKHALRVLEVKKQQRHKAQHQEGPPQKRQKT